jgi:hypothetical protein
MKRLALTNLLMVKKIGTVVRASSSSLATLLWNKSTAPDLIITIERKESTQSIITLLSIQGFYGFYHRTQYDLCLCR